MPLAVHVALSRSFAYYFTNINEDNKKDILSEEFITVISAYLRKQLERYVAQLVATGRYGSKSEVLREGVHLIHKREIQRSALDVVTQSGLRDANAGRGDSAKARPTSSTNHKPTTPNDKGSYVCASFSVPCANSRLPCGRSRRSR